jgi:hypothetical protein
MYIDSLFNAFARSFEARRLSSYFRSNGREAQIEMKVLVRPRPTFVVLAGCCARAAIGHTAAPPSMPT